MAARTTAAGTVVVTAALASAALSGLAAGPAAAAPTGQSIEFTGGSVGLLVCKSQPSSSRITVPAGSGVTFVNRLGQEAVLRITGQRAQTVPANQARSVAFTSGPVSVSMTFKCNLGVVERFDAVSVGVTAARASASAAPSARGAGRSRGAGPTGTAGGSRSGQNSAEQKSAGQRPPGQDSTGPGAANQGRGNGAATPSPAGAPTDAPVDPTAGTDGEGALVDPGAPGSVPGTGLVEPPATGPDGEPVVAVGPLESASGTPTNGPAGLLALIAAVCAIGVGFAAFRVILAQRAVRTSYA